MLNNDDMNRLNDAYLCIVSGSNLWLVEGKLPQGIEHGFSLPVEKAIEVGCYQGSPVVWLNEADIDADLELSSLRKCLHFPEPLFLLISKAVQLSHMSQTVRFCPQCGGRNYLNYNQLAMQCSDCRTLHYPRIFPCIIVAVRKDNQILLAQHPRHRNGMYTVIAGFLEVGETLEQCVAREVKEETGIEVSNIRYFASQPWAFPSSMMMGFLADYDSGVLSLNDNELIDAQWFNVNNMPVIAPEGTIAHTLILQTMAIIRSLSS